MQETPKEGYMANEPIFCMSIRLRAANSTKAEGLQSPLDAGEPRGEGNSSYVGCGRPPPHKCQEVDLETAISVFCTMPSEEPIYPFLDVLPRVFKQEFPASNSATELDREIRIRRSALQLFTSDHRLRKLMLYDLAKRLRRRSSMQEDSTDASDINEAVDLYYEILELASPEDPNRYKFLESLAITLRTRFKMLKEPTDLDAAIEQYETTLRLFPPIEEEGLAGAFYDAAETLLIRFNLNEDVNDLNDLIDYYRQSLQLLPSDTPERFITTVGLFRALHVRIVKLQQEDDIDEVTALYEKTLSLLPLGHPARQNILSEIFSNLVGYSRLQGKSLYMDIAMGYARELLDNMAESDAGERSITFLIGCASADRARYEEFGREEDLEALLRHSQGALGLCPPGNPHRHSCLFAMASALTTKIEGTESLEGLDESIAYLREAVDLLPTDPRDLNRLPTINNLSSALQRRYAKSGEPSDINEAFKYAEEALVIARSSTCKDLRSALHGLATCFHIRFDKLGDVIDMDHAISHFREHIQISESLDRASSLGSLADLLCSRYSLLDDVADLGEAIQLQREILSLTRPDHKQYPFALNELAQVLQLRGSYHSGHLDDLELAEKCVKKALELCPTPGSTRSTFLITLAKVLWKRIGRDKKADGSKYLDQAIEIYREVLAQSDPTDHHMHPRHHFRLGSALKARFEEQGNPSDLEGAITSLLHAEAYFSPDHPHQGYIAGSLASAYISRSELAKMNDYDDLAFAYYEKAARSTSTGAKSLFLAARAWALTAQRRHHKSALRAYVMSFSLSDQYMMMSHTIEAQHKRLAGTNQVSVSHAASCAINEGELEMAVEFLERGRALLWSQVGRYRTPLARLSTVDPELAQEFRRLSTLLEKGAVSPDSTPSREALGHRLLSSRWNAVVEKIRQVDGFSDFLKSTPFATLQKSAANGPVIIVNIDYFRSDALIVRSEGPPILVPLLHATIEAIASLVSDLHSALHQSSEEPPNTKSTKITTVLQRLWELVVLPVVSALRGDCHVPIGSRIWWCPTSKLWALPIHAAGPYTKGERNLPDIFVSSYTPTLSALLRSVNRHPSQSTNTPPTVLLIGQPQTPGQTPLPCVAEEIHQVQEFSRSVSLLEGEGATCHAVVSGLQQCPWAHFACHGHQDLDRPFNSSFSLHDKPLHLLDIIQTGLPNAEFAFLSACHTAAGDHQTPNEAIHLAAGLQFSGFAGVVGTMWAMVDADGPVVAKEFYKYMFRRSEGTADHRDAAVALNLATKTLRRMKVPVEQWINFIHIGA